MEREREREIAEVVRKKKMKMVKGRRGSTPREKWRGGSDLLIRKGVGRVWLMKIRVILVI